MDKSKAKAKPKQGDSTGKASTGKKQDKNLGQKSSKASSASPASPSNQKKMKSKNSKSSCASSKSKQQRGNKATSSAESSSKRSKATNSSSGGNIKSSANKSQEQTKKSNIKPTSKQTKSSEASKKVSPSSHHHQKNTNKNQKQTNTPKSTKTKNQRALKSKENKSEKSSSETVEGTGSSEFNSAREITHSDSTKTQDFCSASSGAKSQEAKTLKMKSAPPRSTCKTTKTMKQKIKSKIVKPGSMMAKSSNVEESEHATDQTEDRANDESSSQANEGPVEGKTTTGEDGYQYKWVPDDGSPEGSNNDDDSSDQSGSSDENIESTKPTINQKTKAKKERPLNDSDTISKIEFESLNDEINELNSGIQMLKHSYGGIIKSLMVMQKRRMKKKLAKQKSADEEVKLSFLTTLSTVDPKVLMKTNCVTSSDKYTMERFVNPLTREDTFQELFDEVDDLNQQTDKLRSCYDKRGNFLRDKFEDLDISIDRKQFNELKTWVKKLCSIVDEIARNYNDDLLNMFRLN